MIELLKQLIGLNIDLNGITFYGKWLFMLPFIVINGWIWCRGFKTFFSKKTAIVER